MISLLNLSAYVNLYLVFRWFRATGPYHMLYGGSAVLAYELITEQLRHHDENNLRPKLVDHVFALMIIGSVAGFMVSNSMLGAFRGFLVSTFFFAPTTYWFKSQGALNMMGHQ